MTDTNTEQLTRTQILDAVAECLDVGMDGSPVIEAVARHYVGASQDVSKVTIEVSDGSAYEVTVQKRTW